MALPLLGRGRGHRRQNVSHAAAGSTTIASHGDFPVSIVLTTTGAATATVEYTLDSWAEAEADTATWVSDGTTYAAASTTAGLIDRPVNAIKVSQVGTGTVVGVVMA